MLVLPSCLLLASCSLILDPPGLIEDAAWEGGGDTEVDAGRDDAGADDVAAVDEGTGFDDAAEADGPEAGEDVVGEDGEADDDGGEDVDAAVVCGDAAVQPPEECDDGNVVSGDGCETDCRFSCHGDGDCPGDGNVCTTEACVPGGTGRLCARTDNADPCDDADPCTVGDVCSGGACFGAELPCPVGGDCVGGACVCPAGTVLCGGGTACTSDPDSDADGVCDADDPWDCGPTAPTVTPEASHLYITITRTSLAGGGVVLDGVVRGSAVEISLDYTLVDCACPTCNDGIEVGLDPNGPQWCIGYGVAGCTGRSGTYTGHLDAPDSAGIQYVGIGEAHDASCPGSWLGGPPVDEDRRIGVFCVVR